MPAAIIDKNRVAGSLYGLLVGDAIAVPVHWFYSPKKLRADYGELTEMTAPKKTHAESSELLSNLHLVESFFSCVYVCNDSIPNTFVCMCVMIRFRTKNLH
jgi:ADP-ribosylglycohydrolase